jgi:hypothetical protein
MGDALGVRSPDAGVELEAQALDLRGVDGGVVER